MPRALLTTITLCLLLSPGCQPTSPEGDGPAPASAEAPSSPQSAPVFPAHRPRTRKPLPPAEVIAKLPPDGGPEFNRLIHEVSPYLRQHARNAVDWYPWGEEAFAKARQENKPIFLSIGYSTCHWCHVMEHESFEKHERIAELLNTRFVPIKVDREERPDVDQVYMRALHALGRRGGWPLSMFLLPDKRPFYGGTYWPAEDQGKHRGFVSLLELIAESWEAKRERIEHDAGALTTALARSFEPRDQGGELDEDVSRSAFSQLSRVFDAARGGFGEAPKFPQAQLHLFLLRYAHRTREPKALEMVETTLDAMACGGMYDQLGGGFHRYSTDAEWLLPHFEKMLYDQALLARAYLELFVVTGAERHAEVARGIFRYMLRDLRDPTGKVGAFYSAEDADSEGVEGKFYVWTPAQIEAVLGKPDAARFCTTYGVVEGGNVADERTGKKTGESVLHLAKPLGDEDERAMAPLRAKLQAARAKRVRPALDDKVLTDWNGLAIWALAYGGRVLAEPAYTRAAREAATFVVEKLRRADGRLLHCWRAGKATVPGFLTDHAYLALGLLELFAATGEPRWLEVARDLGRDIAKRFGDKERGGFFDSAEDNEQLIVRASSLQGGARPAGAEVTIEVLRQLADLHVAHELRAVMDKAVKRYASQVNDYPAGYPFFLCAMEHDRRGIQVILTGPEGPERAALEKRLARHYIPGATVLSVGPEVERLNKLLPWMEYRKEEVTRIQICRDRACGPEAYDMKGLEKVLADLDKPLE